MPHLTHQSAAAAKLLLLASALLPLNSFAATVATFPAPTTLENIVADPSGNLFVTAINKSTIYRVTPNGGTSVFAQVPAPNATFGIARGFDGSFVTAGGSNVYRFSDTGSLSSTATITGARSLNGVTLFSPGTFLIADTSAGTIWRYDAVTNQSQAWSTDPRLGTAPGSTHPFGANGVKVFNGNVYVSNTSSDSVLRIPILADGSAGTATVYATGITLDDFAIASDGSLFGATQFGSSVVKISPDGTRTTIATTADGLLGDAAIAFGRLSSDEQSIYVVNNGGAFLNLPGGPQDGSVVRLDVGVTGVSPELAAAPEPQTVCLLGLGFIALALFAKSRQRLPN